MTDRNQPRGQPGNHGQFASGRGGVPRERIESLRRQARPGAEWLSEALATRDIERVSPDMAVAGERFNQASAHVRSALALIDHDRTLAMAACHDAIRKAITAHMGASGFRPKQGEGAHVVVLDYARAELSGVIEAEDLDAADRIRRNRSIAEYGELATNRIDTDQVRWAAGVAGRIVSAVGRQLAGMHRHGGSG